MKATPFIQQLKHTIPESSWSWVLAALRQDRVIWESLQSESFYQEALQTIGNNPVAWSPAGLALLAIKRPVTLETLQASPLQAIDDKLRHMAACAFEDLVKGNQDENMTLSQAGLLALSLRERRRLLGSWEELAANLNAAPLTSWRTPLACLYGMLPDPADLIAVLVAANAPDEYMLLGLHAMLSNPILPGKLVDSLSNLLCYHPIKAQLSVLRYLNNQRPIIAKLLARHMLAEAIYETEVEPANMEEVQVLLDRAEMYQISGEHNQAMPLLNAAWSASRRLQAELTAHLAQAAANDNDSETALAALEKAAEMDALSPNAFSDIVLARLNTGQLIPPKNFDASATIKPNKHDPAALLSAATLAQQTGDQNQAQMMARQALEATAKSQNKKKAGAKELDTLKPLVKLLLELDLPIDASRAAELALEVQPNNAQMLHYLSKGRLAAGQSAEAVQAAHMAVALSSEQANLRRQLSKSLMANGEWQAALEELEGIITRQSSPTAGDLYDVAQCALQLDNPQRAAQACQQALHIDAQAGAVHALLGEALIRLGDPQNALQHYEKATQYAPHLAIPWLVLAADQRENDTVEQALETLQAAKNAAPESPEIHLELGKLYLERNEATNALYVLERADSLFSKAPGQPIERIQETMLLLSKALVASGRLEHARQKLEQANQAFPTNIEIAHAYAKTLIELAEYQPAISALAVILHERPDDVDVQLDYAEAHLALKKHPGQAIKALQKVLALAPDHSKALALLAEAEVLNGDLDSALQTYQDALESELSNDPNWRVRLCLGLGKTAHQLKQFEVAIAALQEASQAEPDNVGALKSLAEAYLATGLRKDAMQITHEVYELEPDDPATLMWFSNLAVKFKRHDEAITALRRAAQLAPQQTDILVRLGYVQLHIGETEAAKTTFDKLFNTGTARTSDLREAAVALMGLGETASGIAYLKRALELSPEPQPELLGELTTAYYEAGDHEAALESLDQRIELTPNDPDLLVTKADLLLEMERPQGALACLEHAIQMTPNQASLHHRAALILRAASDLPAALNHAEEAVNLLPGEPAYRLLAAETAQTSLRNGEARCLLGETEEGSQAISLTDTSVAEGIQYLCLQAELALAAGEEIVAANAIAPVLDMQSDNICAVALQARLSQRHGDEQAAQENLDAALTALAATNLENTPAYLATSHCLSVAEAALEIGRWPAALELAHRATEYTPLEPRPHLILAQAIILQAEYQQLCADVEVIKHAPGSSALEERNQQAFEEAITAARRCAPFEDTHQEIEHWRVRGYDVFHPHMNKRAEVASYPANAAEAASAIMAMRKTGDTDQMETVAGKFASAPAVLTQLTITLIEQGVPKALAAAKKLLSLQPSDVISQALFAQVCEKAEDHPKALETILQALSTWEDEPRWHASAARLYQKLAELTDAVCHLEQAIQLEPDHIPHYLSLGKIYLQSGAPGNAIRVLEQAAELSPNNAEIWRSLAQAQQASAELEAAAASAEKAIKLNPRQIDPLLLRAEIALQAKSAQKAEGFVQTALRLKPKDPNALLLLAQACEAQERFQDAITALDEAAGLALEPFEILMARVQLIGKAQGADARLLALKKLLRRYPDHPKVLAELSQALVHAGQSEPAIEIAQMAVKDKANLLTHREKAGLHYQLGKLLHEAGQLDQAVHHLSKSIELDATQLDAYLEIGQVYQKRRRLDRAQVAYQHAIALAPNDSRPYWEAGQALKESKDYVGAEAMLRKAATLAPKDLNIQRQLGAVIALKLVHQPQEVQS